jgi:uncharacterized protein YqcC (DUF446 family)
VSASSALLPVLPRSSCIFTFISSTRSSMIEQTDHVLSALEQVESLLLKNRSFDAL